MDWSTISESLRLLAGGSSAGFASAVKAMQEGKSPAEAMRAAEKAAEKAQEDAGAKSMLLAADPSKMPDTKPFVDAAHAASRSPEAAKAAATSAITAMPEGQSAAEAVHAAEKAAKEAQEMVGWASAKEMSLLTVQGGKPGDDKDEADEDETDKDESEEEKKSDEQKEWKRMADRQSAMTGSQRASRWAIPTGRPWVTR